MKNPGMYELLVEASITTVSYKNGGIDVEWCLMIIQAVEQAAFFFQYFEN